MPGDPRQALLQIYQSALAAVHGRKCVRDYLRQYPVSAPVFLLGIGKAACAMAQGAHEVLDANIVAALVVTKQGHAESLPWPVLEAGHPLPDEQSLAAGQRLIDFAAAIPPNATVLVLLSGGASALVEALPEGVSLAQLRALNDWLLAAGLDIVAMNRIRKRLSRIKGGRLAKLLAPRQVLCLAISDVPGDDPRAIGSGPLVADASLLAAPDSTGLPAVVVEALRHSPPAPAADDACFHNVQFEIIARLDDAKRAAAEAARQLGYRATLHPEFIEGNALAAGARLAQALLAAPAGEVQVWGGETTLKLPPHPGRGGRNQSLALAAALALRGRENIWFLSAGTDGTDGPTADAGALVDGGTIARGEAEDISARQALAVADAGNFLAASGDLIQTGPTGTNVMDLMLGLRT
jgi:hydroxypyruvate reductase